MCINGGLLDEDTVVEGFDAVVEGFVLISLLGIMCDLLGLSLACVLLIPGMSVVNNLWSLTMQDFVFGCVGCVIISLDGTRLLLVYRSISA